MHTTITVGVSTDALVRQGPGILLPTSAGELDLHNFAVFQRFTHFSRGAAEFEWVDDTPGPGRVGTEPIRHVILCFDGLDEVSMTSRDPVVPKTEDSHLDYFIAENGEAGETTVTFHFVGGSTIVISGRGVAAEAVLELASAA